MDGNAVDVVVTRRQTAALIVSVDRRGRVQLLAQYGDTLTGIGSVAVRARADVCQNVIGDRDIGFAGRLIRVGRMAVRIALCR